MTEVAVLTGFRGATDALFRRVTIGELAERLGVARNTIDRARMEPGEPQEGKRAPYRPPPPGWEGAVVALARERVAELRQLVADLGADPDEGAAAPKR